MMKSKAEQARIVIADIDRSLARSAEKEREFIRRRPQREEAMRRLRKRVRE
jgi:hypothetical protein